MKAIKQNGNGILLGLGEILVGILLLIIIALGAVLCLVGLVSMVRYFRTEAKEAAVGRLLTKGLLALLLGVFCMVENDWFLATFPKLTILYGVLTLLAGIGKIQLTVDMIRAKKSRWYLGAFGAVISIACAVVILQNPFANTDTLWLFTGISLIVEAVFDAVTIIAGSKVSNKPETAEVLAEEA